MRRLLTTMVFVAAFAAQSAQATMQVVKYLMTKPAPPSCSTAITNPPTAYTTFATTDTEAYLWFYVTGANAGDVFSTEYYTPGGQYYLDASGPFNPLSSGGNWCFTDLPFQIAGYLPASLPGTWTVVGKYNGATAFTLQFTIGGSSSCTYSISPGTASVAATGGGGTANMTAGSGCAWSAVSGVSWISTSSSGSGNGTISYTVAANSGSSSRSGTISAGGQTLTVTQSGASSGGALFTYNNFASTAGLTLVGNSATANTADGSVLRIAPASGGQSGAVYSTTPVSLGNNATFSTRFQFRFTNPGGWDPADGITFVLATSTTGLGSGGVGMGYAGVGGKSVAIEFDTYNNAGFSLGNDDGNSSNHVSIDTNGSLTNTAITNVYGNGSCGLANGNPPQNPNTAAGCMANGNLWTVTIGYDGAALTVILTDPVKGTSYTAINNYAINLASVLGQNTAYVGFTSGTGSGWENHDIVNWSFANTTQLGGTGSCTYGLTAGTPSTAAFTISGGAGTATVATAAGCSWSAASSVTWITTTSSGNASGTVNFTVAANSGAARTGTITVGGQTLTISQSGTSGGGTGLPVYYRFENGTANATASGSGSILDSSGSAQHGTPSGGVTYSSDVPISSLPLNGTANTLSLNFSSTGAVQFPGVFPLNALTTATMEFYIKPASTSGELDVMWTRTDSSDANRFNMGVTGSSGSRSIFLDYREVNGTLHSVASIPISVTAWTHVAVVKNGNVWTGYANGVQQGQPVTDASPNLPNNTGWTFNGRNTSQFTGLLDEFRITASALTPAQFLGNPGPSSSGGLNLTINQVIDTACPSDKVIVSVTDSSGKPVTGLTTSNFTLTESGTSRSITVVPVGTGSTTGAVSLAILIDASSSLSSSDLANEKSAAKQLVSQLGGSDQAAVYVFETTVALKQDFTTDKTKLNTAIDAITGGSSTALYLAVQTASLALGTKSGRKAIVLMTDGSDTMGGATIDQAIAAAKTAGAPVFTVGFGSANQAVLTQIATQTGGFYTGSATSTSLQSILQSIGQVLSSQYEISYTSGNPTADNPVAITVTYNGQTSTASRTVTKCANSSTGNCTYFLQPQTLSVPAAGVTGSIIVSTQPGCAVTASANVSWIHIIGASTGAVSYQIDPNTSSQRTGTITVGNRTVPVTQDGGVTCTYSLTPTTNSLGALGGTSSVRLTTQTGCTWTATVTVTGSWFRVTSPSSGSGMANLIYVADANTTTSQRTATVSVSGQSFTLTQAGGASATAPNIADGGIVNAASNRSGTIARGSFFTIYGSNLGPAPYQQVQGYPIPDTMGGVIVTVSQGNYNKRAFLHFVSPPQINAILPSDTPLGNVTITVNYNGNVSATATMTVVDTNFGTFSTASGPGPGIVQNYNSAADQPLNLQSYPLKPKQIAILWGTGLGPIGTGDSTPPPGGDMSVPVEVRVGGKLANKIYSGRAPSFAGVDNIYFTIPDDAPTGCSVPVQINAGGVVSNTVRIAISADGKKCQDTASPMTATVVNGAKHGTIGLMRVAMSGTIDSTKPPVNTTFDVGLGTFSNTPAGGELAFSPFMNLPPIGTCVSSTKPLDAGSVFASSGVSLDSSSSTQLDAGSALTVSGPNGSQKLQHFDPNANSGPYMSVIGGTMPVDGSQTLPAFLDPGSYTITGAGGKDVGAFSAPLTVANPVTWNNAGTVTSINRAAGLTVSWSGGDSSLSVLIAGGSTDQKTKKSGGFMCLVPIAAGTFTVPPNILVDLPPTGATIGTSDSMGTVSVMSLPLTSPPGFTAPGLDAGRLFYSFTTVRAVPVQ